MRHTVRRGEIKRIAELTAEGMNAEQISEELNIAPERVAQFMPEMPKKKKSKKSKKG